jgi:hypothetical protein
MGYNSDANKLARHLSDIIKSKKYNSPQDILNALLPRLPRKLIGADNPKK